MGAQAPGCGAGRRIRISPRQKRFIVENPQIIMGSSNSGFAVGPAGQKALGETGKRLDLLAIRRKIPGREPRIEAPGDGRPFGIENRIIDCVPVVVLGPLRLAQNSLLREAVTQRRTARAFMLGAATPFEAAISKR